MTPIFEIAGSTFNLEDLPNLLQRYQLFPQLYRYLIVDQALQNTQLTPEEEQTAIKTFCQQQNINSEAEYQQWLQQRQLTSEQLTIEASRPFRLQKYKQEAFGPKVETYFIGRKAKLDRVVFSLIRVQDFNLAQELYFRIQEGEQSFADVARQYSQGTEANTGGVIGPTPLSNPHPAIARLLSVSQPGQLWAPVKLENWAIILRLEKMLPAQLDDETRRQLVEELFEQWLQQEGQKVKQFPVGGAPSLGLPR
jgi:parvulin-like peptidyl-prolyl isomerase